MNDTSQIKTVDPGPKDPVKGKKRDRSASESKLLKAAEDVFSKNGFKGATTRLIAKKAGVNESLIGRYFDGKMGLLVAIIQSYVEDEKFVLELNYPPQETLEAELLGFAKSKFEKDCRKNFDFFKIVISQAIVDGKFSKRIRETIPLFKQPELTKRLKDLQSRGKISATADVDQIIQGLDVFMFGNIISQRIILGHSLEEAFKNLESFIKPYARGFQN